MRDTLVGLGEYRARCATMRESLRRFDWSNVAPSDDDALAELVAAHAGRRPTGEGLRATGPRS
ncbi:MAG: hypothetical protein M5U19_04105 [Microthrixaceae bacterium]|nr:hypothetical protein [Microthrixaceae bacterium]